MNNTQVLKTKLTADALSNKFSAFVTDSRKVKSESLFIAIKGEKFDGHGVGLSGKWAQYLALQGWKTEDILKYYYPGVEISTVD